MDDQATPETAARLVKMLVSAVAERGLSAEPFGSTMVWVCNRAADPPADSDEHAWRRSPGLRQAVRLRVCDGVCGGWFWVWHAPGEMPEYEFIAPAPDVEAVAARLACVLAVRPEAVS